LYRLFRKVLPIARCEIQRWTSLAERIPDPLLRTQALSSLTHKRFHADGGSVYAAVDLAYTPQLVRLIIALQTISDYLDNLCDRCDTYEATDFHQLHHAMRDAVRPGTPLRPYYARRGNPDDGGYLNELVLACQNEIAQLEGYPVVQPHVEWLVERYCELQEYKHVDPELRLEMLTRWWQNFERDFPDMHWWEFAAATGSTLGMFALFLAATRPLTEEDAKQVREVYFPWVCGLHILLDYLIDLEEDSTHGDFNFVQCYTSTVQAHERISHFARQSWASVHLLKAGGRIHRDVVKGLLGMYLSDKKVGRQPTVRPARKMLWEFGPTAWMFYGACQLYRMVR
jgi:tetraprenyl-beta-curcumene synthase